MLHLQCADGRLIDRQFNDLIDLINPGDLLVFNDTKVIPARLFGHKETGGKVEILIERILPECTAVVHLRASKSPGNGASIVLDEEHRCTVLERQGDLFTLRFEGCASIESVLARLGHIPLPPYINRSDLLEDEQDYQTIYARTPGAVAAPTAGLHFDQAIMDRLRDKGVSMGFVTLHVGSGTFQPLRVEKLEDHVMHSERFSVDDTVVQQVNETRARGGRVIAVGTTSVRVLEAASSDRVLKASSGETRLFIMPGYKFKSVDAMITNFHLSESTLLCLVCAFAGYDAVMQAYSHAVEQKYRFFSYGDAMFISK